MTDQLVSHPPPHDDLLASSKESERTVLASVNRRIAFPISATDTQLTVGDNAGEITQTLIARPAAAPNPLDPAVLSLALKSGRPVKVLCYDASHCLLAIAFDGEIQIWLGSLTQEHGREWALYDILSRVHNGAISTRGFSILVWPLSALGQVSKNQQLFKIPTLASTQVTKANSTPVYSFNPEVVFPAEGNRFAELTSAVEIVALGQYGGLLVIGYSNHTGTRPWARHKLKLGLVLVPALAFEFTIYTLAITYLIWVYLWLLSHRLRGAASFMSNM
ncbi:hypothetical protein FRC08_017029 [Ceratobasidium sp. 394]|nr:hypothetical protein FRC08_017029 [Ceratobasidium sp. 394]